MTDHITIDQTPALPPEKPRLTAGSWVRQNLFSSVRSGLLTGIFGVFSFFAFKVLVNTMFENPDRDWLAVKTNLRLYAAFAYPITQFVRVWVALGLVLALLGLSLGIWRSASAVAARTIASRLIASGLTVLAGTLLVGPPVLRDEAGEPVYDETFEALRGTWRSGLEQRTGWFLLAFALVAAGVALWFGLGSRRNTLTVPTTLVVWIASGVVIGSTWVVRYGHYGLDPEGVPVGDPDSLVAMSTRMPWTVMWLLVAVAYQLGRFVSRWNSSRLLITAAWFLAPFIAFWVILRDPAIDYGHVWSTDLPMFLGFGVLGGLLLFLLADPKIGELGRFIAFLLVVVAALTFVSGFYGWFSMLQKARISFCLLALFALMANNFAGDRQTRLRFAGAWVLLIGIAHYFITLMNSPSTLELRADSFLGGFLFTMFAALFGLMFSFPLGVLLALARTSTLPIFRLLATWFIEFVRGVPFITVLFFFDIMLPLFLPAGMEAPDMAATVLGLVLFSSAYLAENVRGGLQSVRRGQYEAADAIGLTGAQRTSLIVLPQALRVSIPPLVGQAITTYKETSLFAIIGVFDFLRVANYVVPNQSTPVNFIGHKLEGLIFVSFVYWLGSITMSKYSQNLESKMGVGER
jgi:His/Glu/Gln/Arg/opine family amino acid ABC transporter permease subunit